MVDTVASRDVCVLVAKSLTGVEYNMVAFESRFLRWVRFLSEKNRD